MTRYEMAEQSLRDRWIPLGSITSSYEHLKDLGPKRWPPGPPSRYRIRA